MNNEEIMMTNFCFDLGKEVAEHSIEILGKQYIDIYELADIIQNLRKEKYK